MLVPKLVLRSSCSKSLLPKIPKPNKKATHMDNKEKVAQIVAGTRATWHSPDRTKYAPESFKISTLPLKKRKIVVSAFDAHDGKENVLPLVQATPKHFSVKLTSGEISFHFESSF